MDLKPCPFCGSEVELVLAPSFGSDNPTEYWRIYCKCDLGTPDALYPECDKEKLIEAWNRRDLPPEPRTCETCANANTVCVLEPCASCLVDTKRNNWTPRTPQSADVETVREARENIEEASEDVYTLFEKTIKELKYNSYEYLDPDLYKAIKDFFYAGYSKGLVNSIGTHVYSVCTDTNQKGYWWCPECKEEVDAHNVTFHEAHDKCGRYVEWKEPLVDSSYRFLQREYAKTIRKALERYGIKSNFADDDEGEEQADEALAALDRIVGKEE